MTSLAELPSYTLMQLPPDLTGEPANEAALKADFEKGDTKTKISALKKVLYFILNGEKFPGLLMTIIRFVLPSQVTLPYLLNTISIKFLLKVLQLYLSTFSHL
jgi:coatomer subunit beta